MSMSKKILFISSFIIASSTHALTCHLTLGESSAPVCKTTPKSIGVDDTHGGPAPTTYTYDGHEITLNGSCEGTWKSDSCGGTYRCDCKLESKSE